MDIKGILLAFLVVLIWGINFPIIKFGLEELPPILFSALRFLIVAIPAVFFIPFPKTSIWNILGVGVFLGVLKFGFLFYAMNADASAGISSLLLQAQVIFTIILSILIYKEVITKIQAIGILVATIGFSFFFFTVNNSITTLGIILLLFAAFFWSISNIIMKRIKGVNLLHFMVWVCLVPPLPLFLMSYFFESKDTLTILLSTTQKTWFSLVYVSYLSTLIAFAIWGWLLKTYQASLVTPFALLIPIVGIFSSSVLLGEKLSSTEIIGAILILSGLFITIFAKKIFNKIRNK
ncbi:EamA family transporter [Halarcobacter sp.]|uniref:EamA family transporter n=1 Tax=Halarcobacter sp. TaxID=2321133 RepID=UPI0029F524BD|nr:EamA family transporter [Halarcobacter sp.]